MPDRRPGSSGKASTTRTEKETILSSDRLQILYGSTHTNRRWCSFHPGADFQGCGELSGFQGSDIF